MECNTELLETVHQLNEYPEYGITKEGKLYSYRRKRFIKPTKNKHGYWMANFKVNKKHSRPLIHNLIIATFIGPKNGLVCRHLDGNKDNNCLSNIALGTQQENINDKLKHGTVPRGEDHYRTSITEKDVFKIRELRAKGFTCSEIASQFNIGHQHVSRIAAKSAWSHI